MIKNLFIRKNSEEKFWNWFEKNNNRFISLQKHDRELAEKLIDEILAQLHLYCDKIWIQVGGNSTDITELIFTSEGDSEYFEKIKMLVNNAPIIEKWKFISLMPPIETDGISYDEFSISVNDLSFSETLLDGDSLDDIAITIKVKEFDTKSKYEFFDAGIHKLLDLILGEEVYSSMIYVDIEMWDKDCKPNIFELSDYILSRKNNEI